MKSQRFLFLAVLLLSIDFLLAGCKKSSSTEAPGSTDPWFGGEIGQGGDRAAMAARRGAQLTRNKGDLRSFGQYYVLYTTEAAGSSPTTEGFKAYVLADRNARNLHQALQEERFEFVVRRNATSDMILGYEKKADYNGNRLVLRCGGDVELIDDQRFQTELKAHGN
jgi:hypothetical protein